MKQVIDHRGIGASEIAAALGLSPYKAPLELWLEKTGQREGFAGNDATEWGHDVEPALREWYVRRSQAAVWVPPGSLFHDGIAWMRSTPDGIVLHADAEAVGGASSPDAWLRGFEAKNVGWRSAHRWGEPGSDEVPIEYLLQAQQGMAVTGLECWDIVASIGGAAPEIFPIVRDEDLIGMLIEGGDAFMSCVARNVAPPIDGTEAWSELLAERYPFAREDFVPAGDEDERNADALRRVRASLRELELDKARLENLLKAAIGERAGIETVNGRLTWKPSKPKDLVEWPMVVAVLQDAAGYTPEQMAALVRSHTKKAKAPRPFCVPRSWSATAEG